MSDPKEPPLWGFFVALSGGYMLATRYETAHHWLHGGYTATPKEKPRYQIASGVSFVLAERVGFEPTVVLPLRLISSQVHSTTLPPLLCVEAFDYSWNFRMIAGRRLVKKAR
jgi:hypothetical protein